MKRTKKNSGSRPSTKRQGKTTTTRREILDADLKQVAGGTISQRKAGKGQQEFTVSHTIDKAPTTLL